MTPTTASRRRARELTRQAQESVLGHLASGLTLREIAELKRHPAPATVCGWCKSPAFARRYRAAVRQGARR